MTQAEPEKWKVCTSYWKLLTSEAYCYCSRPAVAPGIALVFARDFG
jgi:hypothetical protein